MGKIFGISDLPVSTLHSALQGPFYETISPKQNVPLRNYNASDKFVLSQKSLVQSNAFVRMRNNGVNFMKRFVKLWH